MGKDYIPLHLDPLLGKLESRIMDILWQMQKATVREVLEELRTKRKIAYTTVMTVMDNLFQKNFLLREKCGKAYCYKPKLSRDKFFKENVSQIVDQLITEYGNLATVHFVRKIEKLDPQLKKEILSQLKKND
jgi:predicted transcriptional regulator